MKFLLSEFWHSHIYAQPFYDRLVELGQQVDRFEERQFFEGGLPFQQLAARAQNKFRVGPRVAKLNRELVRRVERTRPDVLFVFRGALISPQTLREVRALGTYVIGWNNDDPFSTSYPWYAWRNFRAGIPVYDRLFAYRHHNVEDYGRAGCARVELLRSFYLRDLNYPVNSAASAPYACDVSFIGHWEDDGRDRYVEALLGKTQLQFRLWGTLWERSNLAPLLRRKFGAVNPVLREAYNLALNGTRISLVFLSHLNRDTYTRRCFEIPATGSMMLSEYTPDLASLFEEGREIEFFRDPAELLSKVIYYSEHESARLAIATAGRARVLRDGHEALDRARQVLRTVENDLSRVSA